MILQHVDETLSLSPYGNIKPRCYPNLKLTPPVSTATLPTIPPYQEIHDSTSWSHNAPPPLPRFVTPWDFNDSIPCDPSGDNTHVQQDSQSSYSPSEPSFSVDQSEPSIINSTDTPTVTRSGRQVTKNPRYFNEMHANSAYLDTFSPDESVSARGSQSTTAWT
jgi:hypothetical protein